MKKILLLVFLILPFAFAYAQNKIGIKIYQNTDKFISEKYNRSRVKIAEEDHVNFQRFSIALNVTGKKWTHELELFIPEISKDADKIQFPYNYRFRTDNSFHNEASAYSLRYELIRKFSAPKKAISFSTGLAINPYYAHIEYIPDNEFVYYWSTKLYGFSVAISPRVEFMVSERFSIDLNIPLKVYDLQGEKNWVENPAIPLHQQTSKDFDNEFFENVFTVRIGFTYVLRK